MTTRNVEIAIIGAGTAGMSAYREARKHTDRIALIEGGPLGTTCARVGCMPSKLLIAPADARHRLSVLPEFGIESDAGRVDGKAVMKRVREERDRFVGFVKKAVDRFDSDHMIRAFAKFEGPHTLELTPTEHGDAPPFDRLQAERIVIATGARASVPPPFRKAGDRLIVNDDVFYWKDLPESVAVFGAGVIGLELGQALHRLGVRVRLFGLDRDVAGLTDPAIREYAAQTFEAELPATLDAQDAEIDSENDEVAISFTDTDGTSRTETFEYLLAATGRTPNLDALALENSGLELNDRGVPEVDPQTGQAGESHIFLAGDVTDELPLLHEAADEGRMAGYNAALYPRVFKRNRYTPLAIVFTDPQIATVGQRHADLVESGTEFEVGEVSFEDQGRSRVMLVNRGLLHVYGERESGLLLGAEMIGPSAEHLAHLLAWSVQARMTVSEILEMPFYHPVIEEGLRTALRDLNSNLGMGPQPPQRCIDCGPGG